MAGQASLKRTQLLSLVGRNVQVSLILIEEPAYRGELVEVMTSPVLGIRLKDRRIPQDRRHIALVVIAASLLGEVKAL